MKQVIFNILFFSIGISIGVIFTIIYFYKTSTKELQKRLDIFKNILNNLKNDKCSFHERIGDIVYINIGNEEKLILNISDNFFGIYNGINFTHVSSNDLSEEILFGIPNIIKYKFVNEINDVVYLGEIAYSKSYIIKNWGEEILNSLIHQNLDYYKDVEEILNLDDILDKISEKGLKSLNENEKKFLKNYNRRN